jgi:hypothetical protein
MSDTVIVKVYSSGKTPELFALVPLYGEGDAPPDEDLFRFAKSQLRNRMPAAEIDRCHFKVERINGPKPAHIDNERLASGDRQWA